MTEAEVLGSLGKLVGATTGWNDEAVTLYAQSLVELESPEAFARACSRLAVTWEDARRPPLASILNLYRSELERMRVPSLPSAQGIVPPAVGIEIARDAFVKERKRLGLRADMEFFDRIMAPVISRFERT